MARRKSTPALFAAIWRRAFRSVDRALDKARKDLDTPPSALLDAWIAAHTHPALPLRPVRRAPAVPADIEHTQARLGFALPAALQDLYLASDGLDWLPAGGEPMACGGYFPALAQLGLAADLTPPLSMLAQQHWQQYRAASDDARHIELHAPGALTALFAEPEMIFEFAALDGFLALQLPPDSGCLLMVQRAGLGPPLGCVIEIENLTATRYDGLAHWMSATIQTRAAVLGGQ